MSRTSSVFALACLVLAACGNDNPPEEHPAAGTADKSSSAGAPSAETAAQQITGELMRDFIVEFASDKYQGRGPAGRGDVAARKYLIEQLKNMGLSPGASDGGWEQPFDLVGVNAAQPAEWEFAGAGRSLVLKQWEQFIAGSGVQSTRAEIRNAELVFVGYGIQAPEYDWDDFKGQDLSGKVLVIMNNDPDWDPGLFGGETRLWYGRWDYKYLEAARQGAAGAIIIHTTASAGYPFQVVQTSWTGEQFELPAGDEPRSQINAWVTDEAAHALVEMAGHDLDALRASAARRDFQPVNLGITTSFEMDVALNKAQSANVLGLIPGSDPILSKEVVVYTAHHDHLGVGTPNADGDAIYNGALDNATGCAQVLAIAKAIKALPKPPRRSILIAYVGAEEQGLLGSEYYAAHPTYPPGKIAANINYDGGNIWGRTRDVTYIGFGKSSIDAIVTAIAAEQGRVVKPDQFADKGYFYRSDQFNFAKIGVPALYLDTGTDFVDRPPGWGKQQQDRYTSVNYHQPSDEYAADWTFEGMIEDALLGYWTGLTIANAAELPSWNPGDEFEAARLDALSDGR